MKTRRNGPASPSRPIRKRAATATSPPTKPGPKRPRAGTRENVDPGNEEEKRGPRRSSRRKKTGEGEDNEDDKDDDDDDDDTGGETTGDEEDEEDEGEGEGEEDDDKGAGAKGGTQHAKRARKHAKAVPADDDDKDDDDAAAIEDAFFGKGRQRKKANSGRPKAPVASKAAAAKAPATKATATKPGKGTKAKGPVPAGKKASGARAEDKLKALGAGVAPPARPAPGRPAAGSLPVTRTRRSEGVHQEHSEGSSERSSSEVEAPKSETAEVKKEDVEMSDVEVVDDDQEDIKMESRSPSPELPHGSSRSTGGIIRGKAAVFNSADAEEMSMEAMLSLAKHATVDIYVKPMLPPNLVSLTEGPAFRLNVPPHGTFGQLLPALVKKFKPIADEKSSGGNDQTIYVWDDDSTSPGWIAQGSYPDAVESDEAVNWLFRNNKPYLSMLLSD
ncbi:hypothetical protein DFP72DRAFT_1084662 [Ephemerocybe angulata]|uniref:Uncharacterized protein n=1 Tax=Ephemerocybe angulata TaxID=980116 RepID=A0A8H6H7Z6_9AGAR|nr:hypothetical protein DFP72DRAFT_1084662 [Tulosesus angulatus]